MAIPKRHIHAPGAYFISSRTWENRRLFVTEPICQIFIRTLLKYRDENKYAVHGFVLMPDHFHVLMTLSQETSLERAVQLIKGGSAHAIGDELNFSFLCGNAATAIIGSVMARIMPFTFATSISIR